ncbi:hypothetical protein M6D81_05795 [Paenibacillus sp. J5C_2022]|nr:hypothetical protein [Paenibacillus sp. J5C2022]
MEADWAVNKLLTPSASACGSGVFAGRSGMANGDIMDMAAGD